ncbi:MAG: ribosomal RNA small subunit methyltransferase A [Nanohaloarchaea archaeon]|nr:ribosomal RNA small subunit methyltransferase A [Candidatus Nanohaloarchaea archaeon]
MSVQEELKRLGVQPVDGQNFLTSEAVIKALVEAGEVEDKNVLEIGPGTGAITEELTEKSGKIYTVENDSTLANHMKQNFEDIDVVEKDFLDYEIPGDIERCVSNLPFRISSETLEKLGKRQIQSSLILQKELAERAVAEPGSTEYGRFTVMVNYYFVPVKLRDVSSRNYYPSPEVETSILKLYPNKERHGIENEDQFFKTVRALFTHKRKKVRNAFVDSRHILDIEKEEAKELRDELPHSEERVVNLDIRKISDIAEFLNRNDIN